MDARMTARDPLLDIRDLSVACGALPVIRRISLPIRRGEVLGVVGESGCGKSTLLSAILGLLPNGWCASGKFSLEGQNLLELDRESLRRVRGDRIGIVFQNPGDSLNPSRRIKTQFYEALRAHRPLDRKKAREMAMDILLRLHLEDAACLLEAYPFQLSGGQQQRVAIALAMVLQPALLLADEPTSALDVTVQAQVLRELLEMREHFGTAILLVTHNIGVISRAADTVAVLYAGRVIEYGEKAAVLHRPAHPYTRALLEAVPDLSGRMPRGLPGLPPTAGAVSGCALAPRCPLVSPECREKEPQLRLVGPGHLCACRRREIDG